MDECTPHDELEELEHLLQRQLHLLGQGDIEGACELVSEGDAMARRCAQRQWPQDRLKRIKQLHQRVVLSLAMKKDEISRQISSVPMRKKLARIYGVR